MKAKEIYIVVTGAGTYLADTTERTSPVVAHTRSQAEAVRLTHIAATAEAEQVKGIEVIADEFLSATKKRGAKWK